MKITTHEKVFRTLQDLGLSNLEIKLYLTLLSHGTIPASLLARKLNINRSTTRYTLENLKKKKLAIQTEKNKTFFFTAESPERIPMILQEQQSSLAKQEYAVSKIVNDLKTLQNPNATMPKIQFFEGSRGFITVLKDIIKECKETGSDIYGHANIFDHNTQPELWEYLTQTYTPEREKIGNSSYMIWESQHRGSAYLKNDKAVNRTSIFVPYDQYPLDTGLQIYGSKVAMYSKNDLTGVIIEHPKIKQDQMTLFKMAWNFALTLPENQNRGIKTL